MNLELIKKEAESFAKKHDLPYYLLAEFAKHCVEIESERIRRLLSDDAYACAFQSMGQYRSAMLRRLQPLPPAPGAA